MPQSGQGFAHLQLTLASPFAFALHQGLYFQNPTYIRVSRVPCVYRRHACSCLDARGSRCSMPFHPGACMVLQSFADMRAASECRVSRCQHSHQEAIQRVPHWMGPGKDPAFKQSLWRSSVVPMALHPARGDLLPCLVLELAFELLMRETVSRMYCRGS